MEEVETIDRIIVLPSSSPFPGFHGDHRPCETLRFSHLDTDRNLDVSLRSVRVYAGSDCPHALDPFSAITRALSVALSSYYPLAGTLRRGCDRLEVHCAEGQGVPVIRASSRRTLAYFDYLNDFGSPVVDSLVPNPAPFEVLDHPLMLQVTVFACGGFGLGICVHHCFFDGPGGTLFLSAVAEIARGARAPTIEPVWDRETLLGPRCPPRMEVDWSPFLQITGSLSDPYCGAAAISREYFHVSVVCLERLRAQIRKASGSSSFTTFEVLIAFIWRARVKAAGVRDGEKVKVVFSMNIRKLLNPCLPASYWGNGCVPVYAQTTAGELVGRPLVEAAELIRKSKSSVTEEHVRSFIDFQELYYAEGITAGQNVSGFTDWRHLNQSAVDFGWGSPISFLPLSFKLLGTLEPCIFMPYPSAGRVKQGGFRALVSLPMDIMPAFRTEMNCLAAIESRV